MKRLTKSDPSLLGTETGNTFNLKCRFCEKNLSSRQNLKEHIYLHTGETPYKCKVPGCNAVFRQGSLFSLHKSDHKRNLISARRNPTKSPFNYPKLSKLIEVTKNNIHYILQDFEKSEWIEKIGRESFEFAKTYLDALA